MPARQQWPIPDPIDADRVCIKLNVPNTPQHMQLLQGALMMLAHWDNYDKTGDTRGKEIADVWRNVLYQIDWDSNQCNECDEGDCIEYPNNASIIEWHPNNPHTGKPTSVPGYPKPPWYKIIEGIIGGIEKDDVLADISTLFPTGAFDWFEWLVDLPNLLLESGLPRFRVRMSGTGTVELHLLQVPQGGLALVWRDDDPTTAELVGLQSVSIGSLVSVTAIINLILGVVTGQLDITPDVIHEMVIEEPGDHYIDVVLIPNLTFEITDAGWGGGLRKVVLCGFDEVIEPCKECEPRTDGDKLIEDWMDEIGILDPEELIAMFECAMPFVGQIVAGIVAPSSTAWLELNGTEVNKADYPKLWQVLDGMVTDTATTFFLPDYRDRILMGAGTTALINQFAGQEGITLAPDNLPVHAHTIGAHTHTTEAHTHTQDSHTHTQNAHTHAQNAHTHTQDPHTHTQNSHNHTQNVHTHTATDLGHTHDVDTKATSAAGAQNTVMKSNNSGTTGTAQTGTGFAQIGIAGVTATNNATTATNQNATATNQDATATNQDTTATNIATTATNQDATVTVNASEEYETGETGDAESFPIIPPVVGVKFFIFSGCVGEGC